ncbi:MAG: hypothetical protein MSS87_07995 [Bacteroidales bacterium]|nr:hypothetical protein [Bacteroidales bacterium]MDY5737108.1 hypothetical protein [Candidatus Onthomorpha sp.]
MSETFVLIIATLCILGVTALLIKSFQKRSEQSDNANKHIVKLSRIGSIIFYLLIIILAVFFLIMYIKWKQLPQ